MASFRRQLMSTEQFANERELSDEIWNDYDVFDEGRDSVDLKQIVVSTVAGNFEHPQGHGKMYLSDSLDRIYSDDWFPDQLSKEDTRKFCNKLYNEALELSEKVFDEVEPTLTNSSGDIKEGVDIEGTVESAYDDLNLPETY